MGTFDETILLDNPEIIQCDTFVGEPAGVFAETILLDNPEIIQCDTFVGEPAGVFAETILLDNPEIIQCDTWYGIEPHGIFAESDQVYVYAMPGDPGDDTVLIVVGLIFDFVGNPLYGIAPLEVRFTDESAPYVEEWLWDFGDGETSTEQHPIHTYTIPGTYTISTRYRVGSKYYYKTKINYITVWPGGLKVSTTNKSYSLAIKPEQGNNWREISGDGWVYPEARVGTFKIFDTNNQPLQMIIDSRTRRPYMIASRTGPVGSGIVTRYVDRYGLEYGGNIEIPWKLLFKEHRGNKENNLIEHLQTHVFTRPQDEAVGYRSAQQLTIKAYEDGNVIAEATISNIPQNGDNTFDRKIEGHRIQIEISGTASYIKVVSAMTDYIMKAIRGNPTQREMTQHTYQEELAGQVFWLSKGVEPTLDRATGNSGTGSIAGTTTGPDGSDSAMVFSAASTESYVLGTNCDADFSIFFGISSISTDTEIIKIGNITVTVRVAGNIYTVEFNNNGTLYSQILEWSGLGWTIVKISRSGMNLIVSENGSQLTIEILDSVQPLEDTVVFTTGNAKRLFDPRLYNSRISEAAFNYYYDNVVNHNGDVVIPV